MTQIEPESEAVASLWHHPLGMVRPNATCLSAPPVQPPCSREFLRRDSTTHSLGWSVMLAESPEVPSPRDFMGDRWDAEAQNREDVSCGSCSGLEQSPDSNTSP